ncbi:nucleotidyltransferase domain-containing protein [Candidatus Woesearchaeota archaeon]|nr:nucleotidyltransferase domain-containing protein [Candidatus Woesearchaeota archaeon]
MLILPKEWLLIEKKIKVWIRKMNVVDVLLFGSVVRGKSKPQDIDLCIILTDEQESKALDLIDSLSKIPPKGLKVQINHLTERAFILGEDSLVTTLLFEGKSIRKGKKLAVRYGLKPTSFFQYSLAGFSNSERVRLHYALRGRAGSEGILAKFGGELVNDGLVSISVEQEDAFAEFLRSWNVEFKIRRVLVG